LPRCCVYGQHKFAGKFAVQNDHGLPPLFGPQPQDRLCGKTRSVKAGIHQRRPAHGARVSHSADTRPAGFLRNESIPSLRLRSTVVPCLSPSKSAVSEPFCHRRKPAACSQRSTSVEQLFAVVICVSTRRVVCACSAANRKRCQDAMGIRKTCSERRSLIHHNHAETPSLEEQIGRS
jgi:hypothetical protein